MDPTVTRKARERQQKMMIEAILKKELINNSRIEERNKTKVRSGMSKGRAEWKVQTKNFFDLLFVIL